MCTWHRAMVFRTSWSCAYTPHTHLTHTHTNRYIYTHTITNNNNRSQQRTPTTLAQTVKRLAVWLVKALCVDKHNNCFTHVLNVSTNSSSYSLSPSLSLPLSSLSLLPPSLLSLSLSLLTPPLPLSLSPHSPPSLSHTHITPYLLAEQFVP